MKKRNLDIFKNEIAKRCSLGSICATCLALAVCDSLCKERNIDKGKDKAPCEESWDKWLDLKTEVD